MRLFVTIQKECACGQQQAQIMHIDSAEETLSYDTPPEVMELLKGRQSTQERWIAKPLEIKMRVHFTGEAGKLEMTGVEWKDNSVRCITCGEDALFKVEERDE
jgi:hypothetical protein